MKFFYFLFILFTVLLFVKTSQLHLKLKSQLRRKNHRQFRSFVSLKEKTFLPKRFALRLRSSDQDQPKTLEELIQNPVTDQNTEIPQLTVEFNNCDGEGEEEIQYKDSNEGQEEEEEEQEQEDEEEQEGNGEGDNEDESNKIEQEGEEEGEQEGEQDGEEEGEEESEQQEEQEEEEEDEEQEEEEEEEEKEEEEEEEEEEELNSKSKSDPNCPLVEGFAAMLNHLKFVGPNSNPQYKAQAVYAVLNGANLAVFQNRNVDSLIKSINLLNVGPLQVPPQFEKLHCFQIVGQNNADKWESNFIETPEVVNSLLNFCAENQEQKLFWMQNIENFHNCALAQKAKTADPNQSTVVSVQDNDDLQKLIAEEIEKTKAAEDQLKQSCENHDLKDELTIDEEEKQVVKSMTKIQEVFEKEKEDAQLRQRENEIEIEHQIEATKAMEKEKECLQQVLTAEEYEQIRESENLVLEEEKNQTETFLQQAENLILDEIRQKNKKIESQQMIVLKEQQAQQKKLKEEMVKAAFETEKDLDPARCYSRELKGDQWQKEIKSTCIMINQVDDSTQDISYLDDIVTCINTDNFCEHCCAHYIGKSAPSQKKFDCERKCHLSLNPHLGLDDGGSDFMILVPKTNNIHLDYGPNGPSKTGHIN